MKEYKLPNGLTVWLDEDHTQPKVIGAIVVKAGAKDCPDTGIAHYFEHLMFKGTDKIGTVDYEAEKPLLDAIAQKYDELAGTAGPERRKVILAEIGELSRRAAAYAIPNEFERLITRYGGSQLNAGTSYDYTVYFNTFSPQHLAHWAEINSERLVRPVFRLFQNELETVYEEKNMYNDFIGGQALEKLTERYFAPHPYAYPVIGSTANLKNPSLREMERFFRQYYIASNIGIILSGDFNPEAAVPILGKAFSRIRRGQAPVREPVELRPFRGKEKFSVKVPVPVVKGLVLAFRGVPANHPDQVALNIAVNMLNNANGTGFLDKLSVEGKVLGVMSMNESLNEAGMLGILVIPKLMFQSYAAAEKAVWNEINRIKAGDFGEELFNSLKLEQQRRYETALEDIQSRSEIMIRLFSQGKTWKEYLHEQARIARLTRDDVMRAARTYFGSDCLYVTKKLGRYPKDNLPKPDFRPVAAQNAEAVLAYARQLELIPVKEMRPRYLDFTADVQTVTLAPGARMYAVRNPVNGIFTLTVTYKTGIVENPVLKQVAAYLPYLGTGSLPYDVFRNRLQALGSTLGFEAGKHNFRLRISGFDEQFDATLALVSDFTEHVKPEEKKRKQVVDEEKVTRKAFFKSGDDLAAAILEKIKYGNRSLYLNKPSLAEIKKRKGNELVAAFHEVRRAACELHYCGKLPTAEAAEKIGRIFPLRPAAFPAALRHRPVYRPSAPCVYFYHLPEVAQSIIHTYVPGKPQAGNHARNVAQVFAGYFGGGMSSLMFQEIREFRSLAYRVQAEYKSPPLQAEQEPGYFQAMLSTQADKTADALEVTDALLHRMPVKPERLAAVKQAIVNRIHNRYPPFRELSETIAALQEEGYTADPNRCLTDELPAIGMDDVVGFYDENIRNVPATYIVVGDARKIDMKKLTAFGQVIRLKDKDFYRK
ncbi:MAG: insulinase family protein [Parabacteroides sp.]|nr:insulinase family protein [Parabacteroides sp.]